MAAARLLRRRLYLVPEEAERELESPKLAYIQLAILVLGTLGVVVTYIFDLFHGNFLLGKDGREFLEQPLWVKLGIVVAALIFLYNISMTVLKGRKTSITNVLLLGLWGIAIFFLSRSTIRAISSSTRCSGGTSSTCGLKACGNW